MDSPQRIAYILQVHKNADQINTFIKQLIKGNQADVYVHIDKKSYDELKDKIIKNKNVYILDTSIDCIWGDFSQVETTLILLKKVIKSGVKYDFVCLRSGQDLVVKEGFHDFLAENKDSIFLALKDVTKFNLGLMHMNWPKVTRKRYGILHPIRIYRRLIQSLYRSGINLYPNKNTFPKKFQFYVGSQWFTIPMEVALYIIDFIDDNEWYYHYFQDTMCPDEWFFQTLIMNSPYKSNVITNNNLLFLIWGKKFGETNSPIYLTMNNVEQIENSNQFFGRKFDESIDKEVVSYFSEKTVATVSSKETQLKGLTI
ncbi:beta-1,6-N-acetylglucosaminyltransferase [Evansella tamaricis]|uniref:Peptide O-xylosyltransferase n=1 Tax=Evansella tamaricis TaxID=2069301 RepID=A0ABS6JFJ7_9BACI|nr:beta-1,6-N-acetylglucosaminyltransferase [Evansella tamaricis]MBU9712170.1 beta-1,6-N-acetylglucosaminyltransferase [Evansella tamaricis]